MEFRYGESTTAPVCDPQFYVETEAHVTLLPWLASTEPADLYDRCKDFTDLGPECLCYLRQAVRNCLALPGEFWECGVYRGGSAAFIAETVARAGDLGSGRTLRLFDTFAGSPEPNAEFDFSNDRFADTSAEAVGSLLSAYDFVTMHPGAIPKSFAGLEASRIAFVHCDLGLYRSTMDCLSFCYSRMVKNGVMVVQRYGFPECAGVRSAVDEFFADKREEPIAIKLGCALIFKL